MSCFNFLCAKSNDLAPLTLPHILQDSELSIIDLLQSYRGLVTISANVLSVAAMVPFLYMEVGGMEGERAGRGFECLEHAKTHWSTWQAYAQVCVKSETKLNKADMKKGRDLEVCFS